MTPEEKTPRTATGEPTGGKRAALYCRTAVERPDHAMAALAKQTAALRGYAQARGYAVVAEYQSTAHAGNTDQRPGLDRLYAALAAGEADVVLVTALDRLGYFGPVLGRIVARLDATGTRLVSLGEPCDSATVEGRALLAALTRPQGD